MEDDGEGIEAKQLKAIQENLLEGRGDRRDEGYGIYNVNERIKLYYGDSYGLMMDSVHKKGTRVTIVIPFRTMAEEE